MQVEDRVKSILEWGNQLNSQPANDWEALFQKVENKNRWFTQSNCSEALRGILTWLQPEILQNWLSRYSFSQESTPKTVGLVMAGNIPLVGFHDFLCVLLSGHRAKIKLSSQDDILLPFLTNILAHIDNSWNNKFSFENRLNHVDAVIATGSDNSARYFEYYFRDIPKIIRKNRTSVAVVMGEETPAEFTRLGRDVFTYFGLGCRNISKVFVPEDFNWQHTLDAFKPYEAIIDHNKYANNYDYQRAIRIISGKEFIETGFLILEKSIELVSPIAVLYYEPYSNLDQLKKKLSDNQNKIQCVVSANGWLTGSVPFGEAQTPKVDDYADNIDTMKFLESI